MKQNQPFFKILVKNEIFNDGRGIRYEDRDSSRTISIIAIKKKKMDWKWFSG